MYILEYIYDGRLWEAPFHHQLQWESYVRRWGLKYYLIREITENESV